MRFSELRPELVEKMVGHRPPDDFVFDGCTACPDVIGPWDIKAPCAYHDYAYSVGGTEAERLNADLRFYDNLRACGLPAVLAWFLYSRVRFWGARHFQYAKWTKPRGWQAKVALFLGRYLVW